MSSPAEFNNLFPPNCTDVEVNVNLPSVVLLIDSPLPNVKVLPPTVTLPVVSGTVIVGGAVTNTTDITTSGDISATNFNSTSDITLKDNVSVIDNALDMINNLNGISWNWKDSGKASLGVSAQNVETVAPELVSNGSHKAVNYNGLIGILIEAVKEQGNQITELRTELAKKANSRKKRS